MSSTEGKYKLSTILTNNVIFISNMLKVNLKPILKLIYVWCIFIPGSNEVLFTHQLRIQTHGKTILNLFSGKTYAVVEIDIIIIAFRSL